MTKYTFHINSIFLVKVCCCYSVAKSCLTPCDFLDCSTPGSCVLHISWNLRKFMSIETVMLSNHLMLCHSLLSPSIFSQSMHMLYFNRCCLLPLKNTGSVYEYLCSYQLHFPIITMTLNAICLFGGEGRVAFFFIQKTTKQTLTRGKLLYNTVMIFVTH